MQFARPTKVPLKRPGEELDAFATGWRRRLRLSLEAPRLRLQPPDLSLLPDRLHFIRVDGRLVVWPTPRWDWVRVGQSGPQRLSPVSRLEPLQIPAFELSPRFHKPTPPNTHFTHLDLSQASGGRAGAGSANSVGSTGGVTGASAGASGAVGAGAAVLALAALVLLARALERCLDQRLFKLLRRRSDEWYTPNVLATSTHLSEEIMEGAGAGGDRSGAPPGDPPPPYSMCLPKNPDAPRAEPPPPYSACYVAFGPQDQPRVHLNTSALNSFRDTGQIATNEVSQATQDSAPVTRTPDSRSVGERSDRARSHRDHVASEESDAPPYSQVA